MRPSSVSYVRSTASKRAVGRSSHLLAAGLSPATATPALFYQLLVVADYAFERGLITRTPEEIAEHYLGEAA